MPLGCLYQGKDSNNEQFSSTDKGRVLKGMLAYDAVVNGLPLKGTCDVNFYESGGIKSGLLASDVRIGKYIFRGGKIITLHDKAGAVDFGMLGADAVIEGKRFPAGVYVSFTEEGKLKGIYIDDRDFIRLQLEGYTFVGGTSLRFNEEGKIAFDDEQTLPHILYHGVRLDDLSEHDNKGNIVSGFTDHSFVKNGIAFQKEASFDFFDNGAISKASYIHAGHDITVQGRKYEGETGVAFYRNGNLKRGTLSSAATFGRWTLPAGTMLYFYRDGSLLGFSNKNGINDGKREYDGDFGISFHRNGLIRCVKLAGDLPYKEDIVYSSDTIINYNANGQLLPEKVDQDNGISVLMEQEAIRDGGKTEKEEE